MIGIVHLGEAAGLLAYGSLALKETASSPMQRAQAAATREATCVALF